VVSRRARMFMERIESWCYVVAEKKRDPNGARREKHFHVAAFVLI